MIDIKEYCNFNEDLDTYTDCSSMGFDSARESIQHEMATTKRQLLVYCHCTFLTSLSMCKLVEQLKPIKILMFNNQHAVVVWDNSGHKNFTTLVEWI